MLPSLMFSIRININGYYTCTQEEKKPPPYPLDIRRQDGEDQWHSGFALTFRMEDLGIKFRCWYFLGRFCDNSSNRSCRSPEVKASALNLYLWQWVHWCADGPIRDVSPYLYLFSASTLPEAVYILRCLYRTSLKDSHA